MYYKNPYIFSIPIDKSYTLVINPIKRESVRLLNTSQYELLNAIEDRSIQKYIRENKQNPKLEKFLKIIQQEEFISTSDVFEFKEQIMNQSLSLWIHNTNACNFRCKYCYIHTKDVNLSFDVKNINALACKIIQTVKENNLQNVTLRISGGEPFLNYQIWDEYFSYLKNELLSFNCKLKIVFLTNFSLIDNKIIEFIKKHEIGISGSIDGLEEYNDSNRIFKDGSGTFNSISKGIKRLMDADITPFLMTVVSNENLDGLLEYTEYVIRNNLSMRFSIVQHNDFNFEKALPIFTKSYLLFEKAIENGYAFSRKHKLCDLHFTNFYDRTCSCGRNAGTIYANGDIYFCQQQVGSKVKLGTIFDDQNLIKVITKGDNYNGRLSEKCLLCNFRYICSGGCPLSRVNGRSEACNFYHQIIPIVYRLIGLERLRQISSRTSK